MDSISGEEEMIEQPPSSTNLSIRERSQQEVDTYAESFNAEHILSPVQKRAGRETEARSKKTSRWIRRPVAAAGWSFAVDGSNFAYRSDGTPDFERLCRVILELLRLFKGVKPVVFCDASLKDRLPEAQKAEYQRFLEHPIPLFFECVRGKTADEILLRYAQNRPRCVAVSNDRFGKSQEILLRLGVPLLRVYVDDSVVLPHAKVTLYDDSERPTTGQRLLVWSVLDGRGRRRAR